MQGGENEVLVHPGPWTSQSKRLLRNTSAARERWGRRWRTLAPEVPRTPDFSAAPVKLIYNVTNRTCWFFPSSPQHRGDSSPEDVGHHHLKNSVMGSSRSSSASSPVKTMTGVFRKAKSGLRMAFRVPCSSSFLLTWMCTLASWSRFLCLKWLMMLSRLSGPFTVEIKPVEFTRVTRGQTI